MYTELDVFKEIENKLESLEELKNVVKFTDMATITAKGPVPINEVWCAVDFLPKKDKTISCTREQVVLLHLLINADPDIGDFLYIIDEKVKKKISGMSETVIERCLYSNSSDLFKEKAWQCWTKHLKFVITWKAE